MSINRKKSKDMHGFWVENVFVSFPPIDSSLVLKGASIPWGSPRWEPTIYSPSVTSKTGEINPNNLPLWLTIEEVSKIRRVSKSTWYKWVRNKKIEFRKEGKRLMFPRSAVEYEWKRESFGAGKTVVFSMLTDPFSPREYSKGITRKALELVLEKTSFRVWVLTKSALAASEEFINIYKQAPERFLVGLSIGSSDDAWERKIELGTSLPSERIEALHRLQEAGIPTFGMLCPVFPDMLEGDRLGRLIDEIHPDLVEEIFAEPYNDRANWQILREGYHCGTRTVYRSVNSRRFPEVPVPAAPDGSVDPVGICLRMESG